MPPRARPAALRVENFRGFKQFELEFHREVAHYLIGPNNAGKSTVVNALALALRGPAFWNYSPEQFDYFRSKSGEHAEEFSIILDLDKEHETLPAVQGVGAPDDVHAIQVSGQTQSRGRMVHRHLLLDGEDNRITVAPRTPLKGELKEKYKDHDLGYRRYYARLNKIRDSLPEVWLLTPENLERSLYTWKTGPLRRLASLLTDRFFDADWDLEVDGQVRRMPETLDRAHDFLRTAVRKFPFWRDDLKPRLEETLTRYIGRDAGMALKPSVEAVEDWLADQLVIGFSVDSGGPIVPLERTGQGWQSLVRMAALDVLRQYPEEGGDFVVLLYEEPETFLHPHLRRKLRGVLDGLAEMGWFVLASTHAPEFISFSSSQAVMRLQRSGQAVTIGVLPTTDVPAAAKFQELLDERGNHEFLFSNRAVFCEGKDDVFAVRTYLEKTETDLDGRSVSVVDLGGVQNLPAYAKMASRLGIPWCGLTDEDLDEDGNVKTRTKAAREALEELRSYQDLVPIWEGTLEASLGLEPPKKAKPEWQDKNVRPHSVAQLQADYPDYVETCEAIRSWVVDSTTATEGE